MWNVERGFGFIADDSGGPDMFLHVSALHSAGIDPDNIRKGERLTYDVESTRAEGEGKVTMRAALVILTAVCFSTTAYAQDAAPKSRQQAADSSKAERTDGLQTRRHGQGHQAVGW